MVDNSQVGEKTRYCFIVRHGERADHSADEALYNAYAGHPDPILTEIGHQQASETGKFIRAEIARIEQFENRSFDKVILTCSPFQRTVATCSRIAHELGIEKVEIDYNYCEHLSNSLYQENPLPHLEIRNKPTQEFNAQFNYQISYPASLTQNFKIVRDLNGSSIKAVFYLAQFQQNGSQLCFIDSNTDFNGIGMKIYPESREQKYERISRQLETLKQEVAVQEESLVLDIKVCHNFIVEKIARKIDPTAEPCGGQYCCLTLFKMASSGQEEGNGAAVSTTLLLAESDDHVLTKV